MLFHERDVPDPMPAALLLPPPAVYDIVDERDVRYFLPLIFQESTPLLRSLMFCFSRLIFIMAPNAVSR